MATLWLSLLVLIPLAAVVWRATGEGAGAFWRAVTAPEAAAALRLTIGAGIVVALVNAAFGTLIAWVLVRDDFAGRRVVEALIDLPFALPTIVAGLVLLALYGVNSPVGLHLAYTRVGVVVALLFVTLPFVVRTVQPVLAESEKEIEEAAALLGASRIRTVFSVVLPLVSPALLTGFALAFARGVGEYGSVIFVAGNLPFVSEIAPLLIVIRLEEFDYGGAAVIATVMLAVSFLLLVLFGFLQTRQRRRLGYV